MNRMIAALLATLALGTAAQASVVDVTVTNPVGGDWVVYEGTGPIGTDNFNSTGTVYTMDEAQGVLVTTDIITAYGTIEAGTVVDSTLIWVDPASPTATTATIDFSDDILGIFVGTVGLILTEEMFGDDAVDYVYSFFTGLEGVDSVTIVDEDTITISFTTNNPGDYIRVITAAVIPLPGAAGMLLLGLGALGLARRRKARAA